MKIYLQLEKAKNGVIVKTQKKTLFIFLRKIDIFVYNEENPITKELMRLTKIE